MAQLTVGVVGTSRKENERRVSIHPDHFEWIPDDIRKHLKFEEEYGRPFGFDDDSIAALMGGMATRDELFQQCDVILLPKPTQQDLDAMKENGILWGWPHCVQQKGLTETAIRSRLTLIAFEAMHKWGPKGERQMHIFYKNNEMAGYASVLDALRIAGLDGHYGPARKAIVISFGSVSRGAIYALQGRGFHDITVYTQRPSNFVADQAFAIEYRQMKAAGPGQLLAICSDGSSRPFIDEVASADIIINGILQDTDNPLMFVKENEMQRLKSGSLIIDISCDRGMGFPFARPTSFENPVFKVGNVTYYGVDHTPSYLWNSASWEISIGILPYLPIVMGGPARWDADETIRRSIEIRSGVIQNPRILSFQRRSAKYPHIVSSD